MSGDGCGEGEITLSLKDTLITDRTEADVAQRTAKGHYNATDLNRVERAVQELAGRLNAAGHNLAITVKSNWAINDIPTQSDIERYRANIATIHAALAMLSTTPQTPNSMRFLTWAKANDIEKILQDVEDSLNRMELSFMYSGEIYAGEV